MLAVVYILMHTLPIWTATKSYKELDLPLQLLYPVFIDIKLSTLAASAKRHMDNRWVCSRDIGVYYGRQARNQQLNEINESDMDDFGQNAE